MTRHLPTLGILEPHPRINDWLASPPVPVTWLGPYSVPFVLQDLATDDDPQEFAQAIEQFLALPIQTRDVAAPYVFQNYREVADMLDEDEVPAIASAANIWGYMTPRWVHVSRRHKDRLVYVQAVFDCEWEEEHGLQVVFRQGHTLSRVSPEDGHLTHSDAYALPESQDRIC